MHKTSRVCSVSRPYFLGPGSLRKHQIPVSAIPCLNYRRALLDEKKLKEAVLQNEASDAGAETKNDSDQPTQCPYLNGKKEGEVATDENSSATTTETSNKANDSSQIDDKAPPAKKPRTLGAFSNAKIETVKENLKEQSLTVPQIIDYCKTLFIFKNIRVMRFT